MNVKLIELKWLSNKNTQLYVMFTIVRCCVLNMQYCENGSLSSVNLISSHFVVVKIRNKCIDITRAVVKALDFTICVVCGDAA
jgi:hypothetical protein